MVNPIKKGKSFEREVANKLTELMGVKYHRVPSSGAFQTSQHTSGHQFKGDVFTENKELKHIIIECKSYNNLSFVEFYNPNSKFYEWIKQCEKESDGNKFPWILFIKISRVGIIVVTNDSTNLLYNKLYDYKRYDKIFTVIGSYYTFMINMRII